MNSLHGFLRGALGAAIAALAVVPTAGHAESNIGTGAGALSTAARLDFRVTVPKVLFLQVGTGTGLAANGTVNLIDFVVPAASVGNGTPIAATATSGDLANGVVTARVIGNNGAVTLTSTSSGALNNGSGDTISFGQISGAAAQLTSPTPLAMPAIVDGATTTTTVPAVGKIVNRDAKWTFSYLNAAAVPPGTYGGINTNGGRVTYTASMP
jgi:hypothetical protein